ncbi:hypothetical protein F4815DRAFT_441269 [Daldinia loculata]|nr:hypothetical protein F4815DRAFT_441269 [Daldinia loculata]
MEWAKQTYNEQYEVWMPWIEDKFLNRIRRKFAPPLESRLRLGLTKAYLTIEQLDKTKVTHIEQVDTLQDGVNGAVAGQVGQGGLLQPVGDLVSKEGFNRAERGGKDEQGGILPSAIPGIPGIPGLTK